MKAASLLALAFPLAQICLAACESSLLDDGYSQMYNLQFEDAHRSFQAWEKLYSADPMGLVSDAAAYLFSEFDRLHILESEFFLDDSGFLKRRKLTPDPAVRASFEQAPARTQKLGDRALAESPHDYDAMFANVLRLGLHADYQAPHRKEICGIAGRNEGGAFARAATARSESGLLRRLSGDRSGDYLLSQKIAFLPWLLRMSGAQTDKDEGLRNLRLTAEKGRYLLPYARLLLAVAALRDGDRGRAASILRDLAREFPNNRLYAQELSKISSPAKTHL